MHVSLRYRNGYVRILHYDIAARFVTGFMMLSILRKHSGYIQNWRFSETSLLDIV